MICEEKRCAHVQHVLVDADQQLQEGECAGVEKAVGNGGHAAVQLVVERLGRGAVERATVERECLATKQAAVVGLEARRDASQLLKGCTR